MKFGGAVVSIEDCVAGMDRIPPGSVDLVVADPPYNLDKPIAGDDMNDRAYLDFTRLWITGALRALRENGSIYVCCAMTFQPYIHVIMKNEFELHHVDTIIWTYSHSIHCVKRKFQSAYDPILLFSKGVDYVFNLDDLRDPDAFARFDKRNNRLGKALPNVWYIEAKRWNHPERKEFYKRDGLGNFVQKGHPTQKPLKLIDRMILMSSNPGDTVLDPFVGSCTAGVSCLKNDRKFIGFEIDPQWKDIIERRLSRTYKKHSSRKLTDFLEGGKTWQIAP